MGMQENDLDNIEERTEMYKNLNKVISGINCMCFLKKEEEFKYLKHEEGCPILEE